MKTSALAFASILSLGALSASTAHAADAPATDATPIVGMLRVLKPDATTVLAQALLTRGAMPKITVRAADALLKSNGQCAFNVKLEEVSQVARAGTVTRLYDNDVLVANVTALNLAAKTGKSYITQPYLKTGVNNVKVVFDAESKTPSINWVQVTVDGACTPPPPTTPVARVSAGSADWNILLNAWGYSNYAVTGLKGKSYVRYAQLVELNTALNAAVKAGSVERSVWQTLTSRWTAFLNDADFKAALATIVPGASGK